MRAGAPAWTRSGTEPGSHSGSSGGKRPSFILMGMGRPACWNSGGALQQFHRLAGLFSPGCTGFASRHRISLCRFAQKNSACRRKNPNRFAHRSSAHAQCWEKCGQCITSGVTLQPLLASSLSICTIPVRYTVIPSVILSLNKANISTGQLPRADQMHAKE